MAILKSSSNKFLITLIIGLGLLFVFYNIKLTTSGYLQFSDGAKFADIARNKVSGVGYGASFSFFNPKALINLKDDLFSADWVSPLMPYSIVVFFSILGASDFSVILTSFVYYLLLVVFVFLLGKRLYGDLVGLLSSLAIVTNLSFLDYASSGASEILLAFEVVLAAFLFTLQKKWATVLGFLVLILMNYSRPLSFIFIVGLIFYWLILNFDLKKSIKVIFYSVLIILTFDIVIFSSIQGKSFFYPLYIRGLQAANYYATGESTSILLRGGVIGPLGITGVAKKVFYHLYNFYKVLPQIASPYMWGLFVIGLFHWTKNKEENALKLATILMVLVTFLVTALTIPFFRYLHPVIPLVYLFATATLVWIVKTMINGQWLMIKKYTPRYINKEKLLILVSSFLILLFVVGQTLGVIFLDSRFEASTVNRGKPPVYVQLSYILRDNTEPDEVIVTNLDTWGSWYGERKTIWFPLEPDQLIDIKDDIDAIYLTSYLIDDENYYMGETWRKIFLNPKDHAIEFIRENYEFAGEFEVSPEETYENKPARSILLVRKQ